MRVEDLLEQFVKSMHVCGVEVLHSLGIETGWLGSENLIALPVALDPVRPRVLPAYVECEGLDAALVERFCSQHSELDPVTQDLLLCLGKQLLRLVGILFADAPIDPIIQSGLGHLEQKLEAR